MRVPNYAKPRLYHRAHLFSHNGVSALCFKRPRAIDMVNSRVTWTTTDTAVTCPKCLSIMAGKNKPADPTDYNNGA